MKIKYPVRAPVLKFSELSSGDLFRITEGAEALIKLDSKSPNATFLEKGYAITCNPTTGVIRLRGYLNIDGDM